MNPINDDDDSYNENNLESPPTTMSYPLAIQPSRLHSGRSSISSASTTTRSNTPPVKLQFINTVHPSESTTAKRISQIRSHVAKDSHARRRQRKAAKACTSCTTYSVSSSSPESILAAAEDADWTEDSHLAWISSLHPTNTARSTNTALGYRGLRKIAPKVRAVVSSPGPRQMIGDAKRDAWTGAFAWNLTDDEYSHFNYCEHPPFLPYLAFVPLLADLADHL
jgi:hypothetical protein